MRKLLMLSLLVCAFLVVPAAVVGAADPVTSIDDACALLDNPESNPACVTSASGSDPVVGKDGIVTKVANYVAWFAGAIAVIMIIFAGFRLVKSSGDPQKITQARETIIYALVGLVVIALARFIIGLVISKL